MSRLPLSSILCFFTRLKRITKCIVCFFAFLLSAELHALGTIGEASKYNAFIEGDFTASATDIQGTLAAGGNVNLTSYGIASNNSIAPTALSLIAGGSITYTNGKIFHGSVVAGGDVSGVSAPVRDSLQAGATISGYSNIPFSFSSEFASLRQISTALSTLSSTTLIEYKWGGIYITGDCVSSVQVINLDGQKLAQASHVNLQCLSDNPTLIVNISGISAGIANISLEPFSPYKTRTLFNFYQATSLSFASVGIKGSVLAPLAVINNPTGHIDGTIIAKKWSGPMELHHFPFVGDLSIISNHAPQIVTTPISSVYEKTEYIYDVEAIDEDVKYGDVLNYSLKKSPAASHIDSQSGLIQWLPDAKYVSSVSEKNSQCYVVPAGSVGVTQGSASLDTNVYIAPLFQQVKLALEDAGAFTAREAKKWDSTNNCFGCHVQAQALVGLETSLSKANVDESTTEYFLQAFLNNQATNGSLTKKNDAVYAKTQTSLGIWALEQHPGRELTFAVRAKALDFFNGVKISNATQVYWTNDHNTGWVNNSLAISALVAQAVSGLLDDQNDGKIPFGPQQNLVAEAYRAQLDKMVRYFLAGVGTDQNVLANVFRMIGMSELLPHISSSTLQQEVTVAIQLLDQKLRAAQRVDGGWSVNLSTGVSDPLTTAWVGLALNYLDPGLADPVVIKTIQYLLKTQLAGGIWKTSSGLFTTDFGTTSLVMAYLPVALDHLGNPDLRVGDFSLTAENGDAKTLSVQVSNRGIADTLQPVKLAIYDGFKQDGKLLALVDVPTVAAGAKYVATVDIPASGFESASVYAEIEDALNVDECEIRNNQNAAAVFNVQVADTRGLTDSQIFVVNVHDQNDAPVLPSEPLTISIGSAQSLSQKIQAIDIDLGDAVTYTLDHAPAGIFIDPRTGRLMSDPALVQPGNYVFQVIATDLRGATAARTIQLELVTNLPPVITSQPPSQGMEGKQYIYPVIAQDPNNDPLKYGFIAAAGSMDPLIGALSFDANRFILPLANENKLCEKPPVIAANLQVRKKWEFKQANPSRPVTVFGPVLVAQLSDDNGDGKIDSRDNVDVIFHNDNYNSLIAVTGKTGGLLWENTSVAVNGLGSSALGDIDGDGLIDIVSISQGRTHLLAFDNNGQLKWSQKITAPAFADPRDALAIADMNHDGFAEIVHGRSIYNNQGVKIAEGAWEQGGDPSYGIVSVVADLNLDQNLDVIAGRTAYDNTGKTLWRNLALPATGFNAVGNFDADDYPEVVFVGGGRVALLTHTGDVIWNVSLPGGGQGGAPTIADVDGDGQPEIGVAGGANYVVFEGDGSVKWKVPTQDLSSNRTGSSVFDFEGDGRAEVVYADELNFSIYDGETGAKLYTIENFSGTTLEYPVIADIDGDNEAEVIYGGNEGSTKGLFALESLDGSWASTRAIWNQHSYHINNINDDGSIPQFEQPSWLSHNSYRLNTFVNGSALAQPDIMVANIVYDQSRKVLMAEVRNRGGATATGNIVVKFNRLSGASTWASLGNVSLSDLAAGTKASVEIENIEPSDLGREVKVELSTLASECIASNNTSSGSVISVLAQDPAGLQDTQAYVYSTINVNQAPRFESAAIGSVDADEAYQLQLKVTDADFGDMHRYSIIDAPAGVKLNAFSGVLSVAANQFAPGTYPISLAVRDSEGTSAEQVHLLTVSAPSNNKPIFTSVPPTGAGALSPVSYQSQAVDSDGDDIVYSLSEYPVGMYIDGQSGQLYWTPTLKQIGSHIVDIKAVDSRGASESQRFVIQVSDPHAANRAPTITSEPKGAVVVGRIFEYSVAAQDPDHDPLSYSLLGAVTSMAISEQGVFTWLPSADLANRTLAVTISVKDGRGGEAMQNLSLPVNEAANNPPSFISNPQFSATVGNIYEYKLLATDPDGDAVSFQLTTKPNGMEIDASGLLRWTPAAVQSGQLFPVEVRAIDARGASAIQRYSIGVNQPVVPNELPRIQSSPTSPALVGETYQYLVKALDPDGDILTYSLTGATPNGLMLSASGLLSWNPSEVQVGSYAIAITVSDGRGSVTQSYTLHVETKPDLINNYPVISSVPGASVKAGNSYSYQVVASDPDGDELSYSLLDSPAGASISSNGLLHWLSPANEIGAKDFTLGVSDGKVTQTQLWSLNVNDGREPLKVSLLTTPSQVVPGEPVTISVLATGGADTPEVSVLLDGSPLELDDYGQVVVNLNTAGQHNVQVTVVAGSETKTLDAQFLVKNLSDTTPPLVDIITPVDGVVVSAPSAIVATIQDENLISYQLLVSPKGKQQWSQIVEGGTAVNATEIAQFDPTLMLNGIYDVVLSATDVNGQTATDNITLIVEGDMKVGNYAITFEDLNIDLAGIPIRVTRTYDTRQRNQNLDFGYGWSIDYQNVRVQESRKLGFSWNLNYYRTGFFGRYCVEPSGSPMVTITLPDGRLEKFKAKATPNCTQLVPTIDVDLSFEPMTGTRSTLEQTDHGTLRLANGNIIDLGDEDSHGVGVDPDAYKLTTQDGMVYYLDQSFGIRKIEEPGGQSITYTTGGIRHSLGYEVKFERNSQGRITAVVLPDGRRLLYGYSTNGDLDSVTDLSGNVTRFNYLSRLPHYLDEIIDPRGIKATRMEYDDDGRLIAVIDAEGNRVEYVHDLIGRTELVKDLRGNTSLFVYDENGRVISETNALGETTSRTYNDVGDVLSETNALGNTTSWTYDNRGNQLTETDALGNITHFESSSRGHAISETNALGIKVFANSYDERSLSLTSTKDALGNITRFHWDTGIGGSCSTGSSKGYTDALGNTHAIEVICLGPLAGLPVREIAMDGSVKEFAYDKSGRKTSEKTWRTGEDGEKSELITRYEYDNEDRVIKTTNPDGSIHRSEYNSIGKISALVDAAGQRTEYSYDSRGNETDVHYPDGTTEHKAFDAAGNLLSETNRTGNTIHYEYDEANRKIASVNSDGGRAETEYDAAGRVSAEIDAKGNRTAYGYDAAGRRTSVTDALGNITRYEYDAAGRVTAMVDALDRRTTYVYNDRDQRVETIYADGTKSKDEFDAVSRRVASVDQANVKTQFGYDKQGRLEKVTDVLNQVTAYAYDEQGNKTTQTDAENRVTHWQYDSAGRTVKRKLPLGQEESFSYTEVGQLDTKTDFNGQVTDYSYDANQRLVRIDYADGSAEIFTYNTVGDRASAQQIAPDGTTKTTSWVYDARNRLSSETQPSGAVLNYNYDLNGNRTQVKLVHNGNTQITDYTYDALNRLSSVTDANGTTSYGYDAVGNRTSISYPNGTSQVYRYNSLNRLTKLETYGVNGALVEQYDYILSSTGRRTQIKELDGRTSDYTYDVLNRLTQEAITDSVNGNRTTVYTYDKVGNRLSESVNGVTKTFSYDLNDRLLSAGNTNYTYDDNGNTLSSTDTGVVSSFQYNAKNQLASATNAGTTATFGYNINGIRNTKTSSAITTHFVVDSNRDYAQVLNEVTGNNRISYTYGDDLISQSRNSQTNFYHYDGLGSTRKLSSDAGNFTDSYDYQAFGEILNQTGTTENNYLFTGEQFDKELNQYYLRARYYNQEAGRFTQQDAWMGNSKKPLTLNKYLYADADGINHIDPTGNMTMGSLSAGYSGQQILAATALTTISFAAIKFGTTSSTGDRKFALWDVLAVSEFKARVTSTESGSTVSEEAEEVVRRSPHGHHTIPTYLCGSLDQQPSVISQPEHALIHAEIAGIYLAVQGAETYATRTLGRHRSLSVIRLAGTEAGRASIANALGQVYFFGGWEARGNPQIGPTFESEKPFYISGAKTSLPFCQRQSSTQ